MATKTPVSILQEMMAKLGNPPKYDLIYDGSGTHEALFKYKVYADKVTATGSGRSKKEAKHEAARNALERLAHFQITHVEQPGPTESIEVMSPYKDKLQENAVGALHDLCATYEIPMPEYEHVKEEGPPHERVFTFICSISKQKEIGVGRTKKQAKQLAANNMLNRLKESLGELMTLKEETPPHLVPPATGEPSGQFKDIMNKYINTVGSPLKKIKLNMYPAQYHQVLLSTPEDIKEEVCCMSLEDARDCVQVLHSLAERMNFTPRYVVAPDKSVVGDTPGQMSMVMLQLNTVPEAVVHGLGCTEEVARHVAARACLEFFKVMMKKSASSLCTSPTKTVAVW